MRRHRINHLTAAALADILHVLFPDKTLRLDSQNRL
jgi:hypothetical protein